MFSYIEIFVGRSGSGYLIVEIFTAERIGRASAVAIGLFQSSLMFIRSDTMKMNVEHLVRPAQILTII